MKKILLSTFFVLGSFLSMTANADGVDDMNELKEMICKTHNNKEGCEKLLQTALSVPYGYGKIARMCDLWEKNDGIPEKEKENCNNVSKLDDYFGIKIK
ncbi:hypothetical protein M2263_001794 [Providencia alcalifaciens]|nr:hypothetical protein [Providencia alcalifaciens]